MVDVRQYIGDNAITMEEQNRMAEIMGRPTENTESDALRDLIPAYARIQVPLCDKAALKECAALLRTLGEEMRILGDRHDITQTQALYRAWGLVKSANARMQEYTKSRSLK